MRPRLYCSTVPLGIVLAACTAAGDRTGLLAATVWTQTAAEHRALCLQVYAAASSTVLTAVGANTTDRPHCVIVDVDETVLDNSPYQARLVQDQQTFAPASWNAWCNEASAAAVPGAVEFAQTCHANDVTVFYVTNRAVELEAATRRNLAALGFPLDDRDDIDVVLCKGEVDDQSNKLARRQYVMVRGNVLAVVGDDLNDFTQAEGSLAERQQIVQAHAADWGRSWFQLPNPMYGSWQRAAVAGNDDAFAGMRAALRPRR